MRRFRFILLVAVCGLLVLISNSVGQNRPPTNLVFYTPAEDASGAIRPLVNRFNAETRIFRLNTGPFPGVPMIVLVYVSAFSARDNSFDVFRRYYLGFGVCFRGLDRTTGFLLPAGGRKFSSRVRLKDVATRTRSGRFPWFTDSGVLLPE